MQYKYKENIAAVPAYQDDLTVHQIPPDSFPQHDITISCFHIIKDASKQISMCGWVLIVLLHFQGPDFVHSGDVHLMESKANCNGAILATRGARSIWGQRCSEEIKQPWWSWPSPLILQYLLILKIFVIVLWGSLGRRKHPSIQQKSAKRDAPLPFSCENSIGGDVLSYY